MKIKIDAFAGIRPRVSSRLLGNQDATIALNCRLYNGKLKGFREPEDIVEGEIETNAALIQIGVDVVSFALSMQLNQVGADVVSRAQCDLQLAQAGAETVSVVTPALRAFQVGVDVVSA